MVCKATDSKREIDCDGIGIGLGAVATIIEWRTQWQPSVQRVIHHLLPDGGDSLSQCRQYRQLPIREQIRPILKTICLHTET